MTLKIIGQLWASVPIIKWNDSTHPIGLMGGLRELRAVSGQWSVPSNLASMTKICMRLLYKLNQFPLKLLTYLQY